MPDINVAVCQSVAMRSAGDAGVKNRCVNYSDPFRNNPEAAVKINSATITCGSIGRALYNKKGSDRFNDEGARSPVQYSTVQ